MCDLPSHVHYLIYFIHNSHMAVMGHMRGLGTARDYKVTDGNLGYGVCIQMLKDSTPQQLYCGNKKILFIYLYYHVTM